MVTSVKVPAVITPGKPFTIEVSSDADGEVDVELKVGTEERAFKLGNKASAKKQKMPVLKANVVTPEISEWGTGKKDDTVVVTVGGKPGSGTIGTP